jgi:hypothetical protein
MTTVYGNYFLRGTNMKFKIGDIVEVIGANNPGEYPLSDDFKKGHRGKMAGYNRGDNVFPYRVKRKNGTICDFNARELKLIRKGTK